MNVPDVKNNQYEWARGGPTGQPAVSTEHALPPKMVTFKLTKFRLPNLTMGVNDSMLSSHIYSHWCTAL